MKLTLLGTGEWRAHHAKASAGYVVETEGGTILKLDMGRGNLLRMAEAGIDYRQLDAILLSHMHPDHIADMMQYLQAYTLAYAGLQPDIPGTEAKAKPVEFYGPAGFEEFFEKFREQVLTIWDYVPKVHSANEATYKIGDATVTARLLKHSQENIGFRIEAGGKTICYTGDTGPCDALTELAKDADILLTECYWTTSYQQGDEYHMHTHDIAKTANEAGVKTVVLTHYPPEPDARVQRKEEIEEMFDGTVIAGDDLQVITI